MSTNTTDNIRKVTTSRLVEMKARGEKISMLTAYDYTMAKLIDRAGIDVILVGDSASNVMAGNITTLPITLDQMIYHAKSVMKGTRRALVVVDMPFGSYQGNSKEALASAIRIMKESHAEAVKMEGGAEIRESIERILCAGIPVMGHLGLTPQSINRFGTYSVRAREKEEAEKLVSDARMLEQIGCFAIVLEKIPAELAHHPGQLCGTAVPQRRRRWCRRPGARDARYARDERRLLSAVPPQIRQHRRSGEQCRGPLHRGCKERGFSNCGRIILT